MHRYYVNLLGGFEQGNDTTSFTSCGYWSVRGRRGSRESGELAVAQLGGSSRHGEEVAGLGTV